MIAGTLSTVPTTMGELISPELSAQLDALDILSRRLLSGKMQGERRSKRRGRSVEFDDYREYVAGDDLRHIDWNVLARLDKFFIKVFQEEEDLALHVVLDASASMNAGTPESCNKLLFASRLATALGYIGLVNNNRVVMLIITDRGTIGLEPLRGRRNTERLGQFILKNAFDTEARQTGRGTTVQNDPGKGFADAMRAVVTSRAGRGVTAVISDLLFPPPTGYQAGLQVLAAAAMGGAGGKSGAGGRGGTSAGGMDVFLIQTLAPTEIDPLGPVGVNGSTSTATNADLLGDLRLTDIETNRAAEVTITPELAAAYRLAIKRYNDDLAAYATARGLNHELVLTNTDLSSLLVQTLRRRGLLK